MLPTSCTVIMPRSQVMIVTSLPGVWSCNCCQLMWKYPLPHTHTPTHPPTPSTKRYYLLGSTYKRSSLPKIRNPCKPGMDIWSTLCPPLVLAYKHHSEHITCGFTSCSYEFLLRGYEYVITNMNLFQLAFQATLERRVLASFPGLLCFTFCLHSQ